jgi:riboflavin synthase
MFTGLIEESGTIENISKFGDGLRFKIKAGKVLEDTKVDDSISINGVCLTVVEKSKNYFTVEAVEETLKKTTLGNLKVGEKINLERSIKLSDRLGGHLVQGHVDGIGKIVGRKKLKSSVILNIEIPSQLAKYMIDRGSIAIDGISLTIVKTENNLMTLSIIPHTLELTTLSWKKEGDTVNIEVDLIAKYVEKLLDGESKENKITIEWLKKRGY